jgi:serine/threonine-protein kinase RsbW
MVIPADPTRIPTITDGVAHLLQERGWGSSDIMAVELALQEAIANAIRHGCRNDASLQVECYLTADDAGDLMIVVRDPGSGFEPAAVPNPLEGDNVLKPGGRGIFLINELMDEVGFGAGGREIQMRKRRGSSPEGCQ